MVPVLLVALLAAALPGAGASVATGPTTAAGAWAHPDVAAWTWSVPFPAQSSPICVVGNVSEESAEVDLEFIRRVFLVRQRFWPDGSPAHPVNLPASSELRGRFSEEVFGQSVRDMAPYWNDRYFHGTRPPPTVASEAAVLLFLERTDGGVGYVSQPATRSLPDGVRLLLCLPVEGQASGEAASPAVNAG